VVDDSLDGHDHGMDQKKPETITVPMGDLIAVSRLLWDIGSQQGTSHQHRVDCFHWGAVLDSRSGLPPHPTPGPPADAVVAFYEGVRQHLDELLTQLRSAEGSDS
jgi:hypothetical protein